MRLWEETSKLSSKALVLASLACLCFTLDAARAQDQPTVSEKPAVCFMPGTDPKIVKAFYDAGFGVPPPGQVAYNFNDSNRWPGSQGEPTTITWSLIPDGVQISVNLGGGCFVDGPNELFSVMDSKFATQGGRATWIAQVQAIFDRWSALTGTSYIRITDAGEDWDDGAAFGQPGNGTTRGDVRIGMRPIEGAGCGSIIAFNFFPTNGDMVLDSNDNWSQSANNHRFMRNVLAHEHGHGLGISHVCPTSQTKLMEPFLSTQFDGPQHDDLRAGQRGYGDPFEPNDSSGGAFSLGTLTPGIMVTVGGPAYPPDPIHFPDPPVDFGSILSIDANGENDYFSFSIDAADDLTVTVEPVGLVYDSSTQNFDGSCNSGNIINSETVADLDVEILDTDGTTVLATADTEPAGGTETATVALPSAGTYFVRVFEGNSPSASQLYNLKLGIGSFFCNAVATPQTHPASPVTRFNRFLPVQVGDPGRSQAIRVTPASLPPPFDVWDCATGSCERWWAGTPHQVCENASDDRTVAVSQCGPAPGLPRKWFWAAPLRCDFANAHFMDWHGACDVDTCVGGLNAGQSCTTDDDCLGPVYLYHTGVIPSTMAGSSGPITTPAIYEVQLFDGDDLCSPADEAMFSAPLAVTQAGWTDTVLDVTQCPPGAPQSVINLHDLLAMLRKFANVDCDITKPRFDLVGVGTGAVDFKIDLADVLVVLRAFAGLNFPYAPGDPCGP